MYQIEDQQWRKESNLLVNHSCSLTCLWGIKEVEVAEREWCEGTEGSTLGPRVDDKRK